MTSSAARARARTNQRLRWRPTENDLGGRPGDPVDIRAFNVAETAARILDGELTSELVKQVEVGSEFLPRARQGKHNCVMCKRPFGGLPALIGWLETPRGNKQALFGICSDCDGPDIQQRLIERLGGVEVAIH